MSDSDVSAMERFMEQPNPMDEAYEVLENYTKKDATIDSGNLYFAASTFEKQYKIAVDSLAALQEILNKAIVFGDIQIQGKPALQKTHHTDLWAIRFNGTCYSRSAAAFIWEPQPSSRDEAFMADCRFTFLEAWPLFKILTEAKK